MSISNTDRIVPSGLSVFGWHTKTDADGLTTVHVDVGFRVGKFGGKPTDKIEFEFQLKRAQIVVICGGGASAKFSTMATQPLATKEMTESISESIQKSAHGKVSGSLGVTPSGKVSVDAEMGKTVQTDLETKATQIVTDFLVQHEKTTDGHPAWEVKSRTGRVLVGNPWDAKLEPRLKVEMPAAGVGVEPTIRVEIRCRGEDLDFGAGIRIKDEKKRGLFSSIHNKDVNLAAAEQLLKKELEREGLTLSAPGEKFGEITLADVILTVE